MERIQKPNVEVDFTLLFCSVFESIFMFNGGPSNQSINWLSIVTDFFFLLGWKSIKNESDGDVSHPADWIKRFIHLNVFWRENYWILWIMYFLDAIVFKWRLFHLAQSLKVWMRNYRKWFLFSTKRCNRAILKMFIFYSFHSNDLFCSSI